MGRAKIHRTQEEEEAYKIKRREQNRLSQRRRRESAKLKMAVNTLLQTENSNREIDECDVMNVDKVETASGSRERSVIYDHNYCIQQNSNNLSINNNRRNDEEHYIGKMDVLCSHCNAKHFAEERVANKRNSFFDCCSHGEVVLEKLPDIPEDLLKLFNIRKYNSCLSFASFNTKLVQLNGPPGPYCFKIQGQIYYQINTALLPSSDENPSYGQLFIVDQNEATQHRLNANSILDPDILSLLDAIMRQNNVFALSYQMMWKEVEEQQKQNETDQNSFSELQLVFELKPGVDKRRYNLQKANEVAMVFATNANGEIPDSYVVIREKKSKELQMVSTMNPNVEPWVFPLFYPFGSQGWHDNLKQQSKEKRITRCQYFKHRLALRDNEFNTFILGGKLFQQWIVDSYVKIEKDRLTFCRANQAKLRVETYQGLSDYLQKKSDAVQGSLGKLYVLPSSFSGSPRNMMQSYQDSMAIARKFGKPDLFITLTCNPKWNEIQENLLPGQQASDRPDICARVFDLKKKYLIDLITKQKLFGEVAAYIYVVEFQKRGLPHVHLLVTLKGNDKFTRAKIIDNYISAEIPNQNENPGLHSIVMKHMIHGPCGDWCLVNGRCSKRFPKPFQEETILDEHNCPTYRRRDTGIVYERPGGYIVDNRFVVPYCPQLLLIFNCHINFEIVSNIKSVKYLYKYFYKGHDAASIVIGKVDKEEKIIDHDEIKDYVDSRYVGPIEGYWNIVNKTLKHKSHAVYRLPVHLPNQQTIVLDNNVETTNEETLYNALSQVTMLLDYFALNQRDRFARDILYVNIPEHYVFKKIKVGDKFIPQWVKRQKYMNCIGRLYSVSPSQTELFHLRLLLLHRKGATSFNDLQTVNGIFYDTFTATCLAMGLIEDDEEWNRAMKEATFWMMPNSLRKLFVRILIHCQPRHPDKLWDEFKIALSEDYVRRTDIIRDQKFAYQKICNMLSAEGKSIANFPSMIQITDMHIEDLRNEDLFHQYTEIGRMKYELLNGEQKEIVDKIINDVDNLNNNDMHSNKCYFIDGPGGSGKTFVYVTLWHLLKGKGKKIISMAFTGIAATLLPEGKTVHKTLGLPVPLFSDSSSNIKSKSVEGKNLIDTDVFIWDEAPMAPRYALEIMNITLQDLMKNNQPFGGKVVILGGDFRQLLPVLPGGTRSETINLSIKFSTLWPIFFKFRLSQNMRALEEEKEFSEFLINLGNGILNDNNNEVIIPDRCLICPDSDVVVHVYGDLLAQHKYKEAAKCIILSARNIDVDEINKKVINMLDDKTEKIYTSVDSTENCNDNDSISEALLPEYLNTLSPPCLPPYELRLRKYCVIMLIRNLNINEGLCNGTRLLILEMQNYSLKCEILTGDKAGEIVFLNRITLYCETDYPFTFKRRQFPIKSAFAMTINKSQGQTFERIGIDLVKDVFSHGQLYVAFSRVRSWNSLKIRLDVHKYEENLKKVKNVVYKELYY